MFLKRIRNLKNKLSRGLKLKNCPSFLTPKLAVFFRSSSILFALIEARVLGLLPEQLQE